MSIIDTLLGKSASDTANKAAQDTYAKQQAEIAKLIQYGDTLPGQYRELSQAYQPYSQAGQSALQRLMGGLGLGSAADSQNFQSGYRNTPGYQGGLDTGLTAAQRALNAGNMGQSGAALKGLYQFGSNYEDQKAGDYMNRLAGLGGTGLQATGMQVGTEGQGLQNQLATRQSAYGGGMNAAGTVGQGMVAGAQAEQNALGNLMGLGGYLGGSFLGGPGGKMLATKLF